MIIEVLPKISDYIRLSELMPGNYFDYCGDYYLKIDDKTIMRVKPNFPATFLFNVFNGNEKICPLDIEKITFRRIV